MAKDFSFFIYDYESFGINPASVPNLYFESVSWANKYVFTYDEISDQANKESMQNYVKEEKEEDE